MRSIRSLVLAVILSVASMAVSAGDIALPEPMKTGGMPVLEAIDMRGSAGQNGFPAGEIDRETLSTILWAATGLNRDGAKWTVPMAMGKAPYCKVYFADASGAYRYDWSDHSLTRVSDKDCRSDIAMQNFAKEAPGIIVLAASGEEMGKLNNNPFTEEFTHVLAGSMSQNIYLACGALNVGARLIYSINRDETAELLGFSEGDRAICAIPVGKR